MIHYLAFKQQSRRRDIRGKKCYRKKPKVLSRFLQREKLTGFFPKARATRMNTGLPGVSRSDETVSEKVNFYDFLRCEAW